jgi:GT2 family glycosyltransferase
MLPALIIVIINLNLRDDTLGLLDSLVAAGASPEQVIIVDNGSTDGSIGAFREKFGDHLQIIENEQNVHFCAASNQGFQAALEQGAKWVLLLNNDTYLATDFFTEFEKALASEEDIALWSPLIFYHTSPNKVWYSGSLLVSGTLITRDLYRNRNLTAALPDIMPVDFVSGCAMLVRCDVFEKIGFFEPSLLIYWDEVDFCWRARQAGFKMAVATRARMWHKISETMGRQKPNALYLRTRNQVRYYRKYSRGLQKPIMYGFAAYKSALVLVPALARGETELLKSVFRGWSSGWNAP